MLKELLCPRTIVLLSIIWTGFVLAYSRLDLPPNLTRLADTALGGALGLSVPAFGRKKEE